MPAPTQTTPIDVVNLRDEPVATVPRGEVLDSGKNFRTAHVFVLNGDGAILLQRLASGRGRHPGRWGSSVAAYLFAGESYRDAAARRLREELGLTVPLEPIGKIKMQDEGSLKFVSLFAAVDGLPKIQEPEHIERVEYWSCERIEGDLEKTPEIFTPTFAQLFRAFGRGLCESVGR